MRKNEISNCITGIINKCSQFPFLFIGSGFTKRYFGTKNWEELLQDFSDEFYQDKSYFYKHKNSINSSEPNIVYPKIASSLEKDYNNAVLLDAYLTYRDEIRDNILEFREKYKEKIEEGISPFKIKLSECFKSINISSCVKEKEEEFKFFKNNVASHVAGIITTNYDLILEEIFCSEILLVYISLKDVFQKHWSFTKQYNHKEMYKIHGSAEVPSSIIITEEDYNNFEKNEYLKAKLLTIFIENPVIFLGYGMNDSNILSIMKHISESLNNEQLEKLKDRLIFIEYSKTEENIELSSFEDIKISMTKITTDNFLEVYEGIVNTNESIELQALMPYYKQVEQREKEFDEYIQQTGKHMDNTFQVYFSEILYEDILLSNRDLQTDFVIKYLLPDLLKNNISGLPMYKYLKEYQEKGYQDDIDDIIKKECEKHKYLDDFLTNDQKQDKENYRKKLKEKTIGEIIEIEGIDKALYKICFLNEDEINLETLLSYLNKINNLINEKNSEIKRLIRIYDFLSNKS